MISIISEKKTKREEEAIEEKGVTDINDFFGDDGRWEKKGGREKLYDALNEPASRGMKYSMEDKESTLITYLYILRFCAETASFIWVPLIIVFTFLSFGLKICPHLWICSWLFSRIMCSPLLYSKQSWDRTIAIFVINERQ